MWGFLTVTAAAANMIPRNYSISNPNSLSTGRYSTEYTDEFFEVYSPAIRSRYAQVYWTLMESVPLDEAIVKRFANKTMAITGYEVDQVMKTPNGDVPVPITHAYNHHYVSFLNSEHVEMKHVHAPAGAKPHGCGHSDKFWTAVPKKGAPVFKDGARSMPLTTLFSEGNGGEFRGSYHGYPRGYVQLIHAPTTFVVNPMQIDTKNREHPGPGFVPGPLPKEARSPPNASYSGLLECPCTDRLPKEWKMEYGTFEGEKCSTAVTSAADCTKAAQSLLPTMVGWSQISVHNESLPPGCSVVMHKDRTAASMWNSASGGACDRKGVLHKFGAAKSVIELQVTLVQNVATLMLVGPADKWFGVGLGASQMCVHPVADECPEGGPYAIIVDGEKITERKLGHGPGEELQSMITVVSTTVHGGLRTVMLRRALQGISPKHHSFDPNATGMDFINQAGTSLAYTEWIQSTGYKAAKVNFVQAESPTCICGPVLHGSIGGIPFGKDCKPQPAGDLLFQHNPTCSIKTYRGGLSCCRHLGFLLDKDQTPPEDVQEYHLKFRYYFQEYVPEHRHLVRMYYQTEANAGEYDIVQCDKGTPPELCVQSITARFKVKDAMWPCDVTSSGWCAGTGSTDPNKTAGVQLIYAGPHCHGPACISMELYHANTGKLLCGMYPEYGKQTAVYEEKGYLALPPCLWGNPKDGLMPPVLLALDDELLSIKRNNNTYGHLGEMASWQMRGIVVPRDETPFQDASSFFI